MDDEIHSAGIGSRVRAARDRLGWSRDVLAERSGMSAAAIAQVESGRRANPRPPTLSGLARALGVSIDYLVDGGPATATMLEHRALVYDSDEVFAEVTGRFLREGLERSETVMAVTTKPNVELLREWLGDDADRVRLADAREWLPAPEVALGHHRDVLAAARETGASWTRIVGEPIWTGRTEAEVRLWTRFESLLNLAFAAAPLSFLCPYDARSLSPQVIEQASHTHPEMVEAGEISSSPAYEEPGGFAIEP